MPKRTRKSKDPNRRAFQVVQDATGDAKETNPLPAPRLKNRAAVALGQLGGRKGGKARAESMTPEERSASAKKAAEARWKRRSEQ